MTKKPQDDAKTQRERFEETARALGADESDDALDRAMDRLDLRAKPEHKPPQGGKPGDKGAANG